MKLVVYGPTVRAAAELAACMDLHITQWVWAYSEYVWADTKPLFERLYELEYRLMGLEK